MSHKRISKSVVTLHLPARVESKDATQIMDNAVDRLAEIQLQKRKMAAEEDEIRSRMGALMGLLDLKEHLSQSGRKATCYTSERTTWDSERLREVLSADEQLYCSNTKTVTAILIS